MSISRDESAALRILIVDDDRVILVILKQLFSSHSFKTTVTESALKALQYLGLDDDDTSSGRRDELPDLILTDYDMDDMNGFELLKKIKSSALKDIPLVIMSDDDKPDRVEREKRVITMLCEDLIRDIFERLQVKSLVRFRSLSKSWCSRISSTDFIRKHSLRSCSRKVLIRHYNHLDDNEDNFSKDLYSLHSEDQVSLCQNRSKYLDDKSTITIDFPCNHRSKVINSCNGILCRHDYKRSGIISLWNPSIRRKIILRDQQPSYGVLGKETRVTMGLGFDLISNDYKIVRISYLELKQVVESTLVYSMKTHVWSSIASPATPFNFIKQRACFLNGVLHWVAVCFYGQIDYYIMTFNMSTHVFGSITLPEPSWITRKPTIINGCLAVISYETEATCWVWVMKEYNNVASCNVLFVIKYQSFALAIKSVMQVGCYFLINHYPDGLKVFILY